MEAVADLDVLENSFEEKCSELRAFEVFIAEGLEQLE